MAEIDNGDGRDLSDINPKVTTYSFIQGHQRNYKYLPNVNPDDKPLPCRSRDRYPMHYWAEVGIPAWQSVSDPPKEPPPKFKFEPKLPPPKLKKPAKKKPRKKQTIEDVYYETQRQARGKQAPAPTVPYNDQDNPQRSLGLSDDGWKRFKEMLRAEAERLGVRRWVCHECGADFSTDLGMRWHMGRAHGVEWDDT